jgi:hypothetical protein
MRRTMMGMVALAGVLLAVPRVADARVAVWFGLPGVSVFAGPPVPPIAVPPPAYYYGPPAYYAPPPVVVAPPHWGRPYYGYGYGAGYRGYKWKHGRPPGWYKHGRW